MGRRWRWDNVPLPEAHLGCLAASGVLTWLHPWPVTGRRWVRPVGGVLLLGGSAWILWSVSSAGKVHLDEPDALVTDGAYRCSRNPMYLGWTLVYVGSGLLVNTAWPFLLLPALAALTHHEITREEQHLAATFGAGLDNYRQSVPRYIPAPWHAGRWNPQQPR